MSAAIDAVSEALDLGDAERFLTALAADMPVAFQTFDDDALRKNKALVLAKSGRLSEVHSDLERMQAGGGGVFVCVNQVMPGKRRDNKNIATLRALFIDHDEKDGPMLRPLAIPPSIIVRSGGGTHYYWLLKPGEAVERFKPAQQTLASYYGTDSHVCDPARVMRLPGFLHLKGEPILVRMTACHPDRRFTIDEVMAAHDETKTVAPVVADLLPKRPQRVQTRSEAAKRCAAFMATRDPAIEGQGGDEWTFRTCCIGGDFDLAADDFWPLLCEWNARCVPPWDLDQLRAKLESSERNRQKPRGYRLDEPMPERATVADSLPPVPPVVDPAENVRNMLGQTPLVPTETILDEIAKVESPLARSELIALVCRARKTSRKEADKHVAAKALTTAAQDGAPPPPPMTANDFGLSLDTTRWALNMNGVYPVKRRDGACYADTDRPVATRPIWPAEMGEDLSTGQDYVNVSWHTPQGQRRSQWLTYDDLRSQSALTALSGAPVSLGRVRSLSDWLVDASAGIQAPTVSLTSRLGWIDGDLILRPTDSIRYVGPADLGKAGKRDRWLAGLDAIIAAGEDGWIALACLGASFAAPLVRYLGRRRPVIGLCYESSRGKGTCINYALSLWGRPSVLTAQASSTSKGMQDMGISYPDLPIFADDLHQLTHRDMKQVSDLLYFLGNGQQRVTSSKDQTVRGGGLRYGAAFYACECPVLPRLPRGAVMRCIEITDEPLPSKQLATVIQIATNDAGALCDEICLWYNGHNVQDLADSVIEMAQETAAHIGEATSLAGDDIETLTIIEWGLIGLAQVTRRKIDAGAVAAKLRNAAENSRLGFTDAESEVLADIIRTVLSLPWPPGTTGDVEISYMNTRAAMRRVRADGTTWGLHVNPACPLIRQIIEQHGGLRSLVSVWKRRGWVTYDGRHQLTRWRGDRIYLAINEHGLAAVGG